jgi:hypothetical protein
MGEGEESSTETRIPLPHFWHGERRGEREVSVLIVDEGADLLCASAALRAQTARVPGASVVYQVDAAGLQSLSVDVSGLRSLSGIVIALRLPHLRSRNIRCETPHFSDVKRNGDVVSVSKGSTQQVFLVLPVT